MAVDGGGGEQVRDAPLLRVGRPRVHRQVAVPAQAGQPRVGVVEELEISDDCFPPAAAAVDPPGPAAKFRVLGRLERGQFGVWGVKTRPNGPDLRIKQLQVRTR
jgi:hypothetical protein